MKESVQARAWAGHVVAEVLELDAGGPTDKAKIKSLLKMDQDRCTNWGQEAPA